ncbi:response regulator transcription factor [Cellulomonas sp. URHD0024]|uniref:response regulator n=1 Tax=Cellulomonas sp. URHD0024 TaxID=1302620 RepID=UPI0004807FB7|nr:response regulator transcription factor [Cellulomonas sp. URHD0024]
MIVDDHEVVRRGIAEVVDRADGMRVVAEASSVAEGLHRAGLVRPQVVLVDLLLPDGTGVDLMLALHRALPDTRSIVLTSFGDEDAVDAALEAGAVAFLLKTVRGSEIADAIRAVAAGRILLDERSVIRHRGENGDLRSTLTPSEARVVDLIADGLSNREIAERLGVVEKTVKNHTTSILAKMGLQRRTQVAAWVASRKHSGWRGEPSS